MYTNGNRYSSSSGSKRKLDENDGSDDASASMPAKQHNYGDNSNVSRAKQRSFGDHLKPTSREATYGDLSMNPTNSIHRAGSVKYSDTSSSIPRVAQTANYFEYGENINLSNKQFPSMHQQNLREGSATGGGGAKHFSPTNSIPYETLCAPPPPPPNQYNFSESKVAGQQYCGYKQDGAQGGYQSLPYTPGLNRYGKHHNMMGQGRGWNQRGRPPIRGYRGSQWPPPGRPSGPAGPARPHIGHPGHMVPPLLPPVPFGLFGPPFGPPFGPRPPPPLFGRQGNQHVGRNQASQNQSGSHNKSKSKKRIEDSGSADVNVIPPKAKGGVLLSPDNNLVKGKKRNALPNFPSRPWNRVDAEKALRVEVETTINLKK